MYNLIFVVWVIIFAYFFIFYNSSCYTNVISSLIPLPCQNTKSPNKINFLNHSQVICIFFPWSGLADKLPELHGLSFDL